MRNILIVLLFVTSFTFAQIDTTDWFPLAVGNKWQYSSGIIEVESYTREVTGDTTMPNGKTYAILDGMILRNHENKYVFEYIDRDSTESLLFDFVSADGTIWGNPYEYSGRGINRTITSEGSYYNVGSNSTAKYFDKVYIDSSSFPYDTTWGIVDLPSIVITKGIGFTPSTAYSSLYGCIINGVQYGTITDVENRNNIIENYRLEQNYPNPFNPTTTIKYQIPVGVALNSTTTHVQLKVYDVLGREVATLVNKEQNTGIYEVQFNGRGLASGIYFYKIDISSGSEDSFVESKKMILLR